MEKEYSPGEFSHLLGVTVKTLQRWDKKGTIIAHRTEGNRRYYTHTQFLDYISSQKGINVLLVYNKENTKREGLTIFRSEEMGLIRVIQLLVMNRVRNLYVEGLTNITIIELLTDLCSIHRTDLFLEGNIIRNL